MSLPSNDQELALLKRSNSELKLALLYFVDSAKGNDSLEGKLDEISVALDDNDIIFTFAAMVEHYVKMKQSFDSAEFKNQQKNIDALQVTIKGALSKKLSPPQLKTLQNLLIELSKKDISSNALCIIAEALELFINDMEHLRASSKVITELHGGEHKETPVVAADINIASKRLVKDVLSINTALMATYPDEISIEEILKEASTISNNSGNFFLALSLLERTTRQLTLLIQRERCLAEEMLGDIHNNLLDVFKQSTIIETLTSSSNDNLSTISKSMVTKLNNMEVKAKVIDNIKDMQSHIKESVSTMSSIMNLYAKEQNKINQANEDAIKILSEKAEKSINITAKLESKLSASEEENLLDPLTKIGNRKGYVRKIKQAREDWLAKDIPLSIMIIDIDKFKNINDSYGHSIGDVVIKTLGKTLKKCIRATDYVARYGGEEFVIVLPSADISIAVKIARKIRKIINDLKFKNQKINVEFQITCSIGVSEFTEENNTSLDVFELADKAMYIVKDHGRDGIVAIKDNKVIGAVTKKS